MSNLFDFPPFGRKVLIVDDEAMILKLLSAVVDGAGFEAMIAASAEDALPLIEHNHLAGMLIDKNLPGIDGIELMRGVRTIQPHCACIIITGFASRDSAIEALHLGASDYIAKPFDDIMMVVSSLEKAVERCRLEYEAAQIRQRLDAIIAASGAEPLAAKASLEEALNRGVEQILGGLLAELDFELAPAEAVARVMTRLQLDDD